MRQYNQPQLGDKYYGILNTLSGKARDKFIEFFQEVFKDEKLEPIFELLLVCDDPGPVINELWFYYQTGMKPMDSPTFKEFAVKYITISVSTSFQQKDNDLSRKALLVGNVPEKELEFDDLL